MMELPAMISESGRYKAVEVQHNPEDLQYAYYILKKLHRRMQIKAVRLLKITRKNKLQRNSSMLIMRAHTWEYCAKMLMDEMEAIRCQMMNLQNKEQNKK